jgi:predicted DNA-binding transcriptional regulator AlpA
MQTLEIEKALEELKTLILQVGLSQKAVLTLPEAVIYTGRSQSNLYKLVSQGRVFASKPEGKMLYFDRVKLEAWMLRNPIRTIDEIEQEAISRVTFPINKSKKYK